MFPPRPRANAPPPPPPRGQQPNQLAAIRLPEVNEVGTLIIRGVGSFARRNKVLTGWYLLGVVVLLYTSSYGGRQLNPNEVRQYNKVMNSIDLQKEYDAVEKYWNARHAYTATKGWLWSCDRLCQQNKRRMESAEQQLAAIRAEGNARMSDAKAIAGLTSDIAITEMKDSFWQYFTSGKQFAKRQSMWDLMFIGIRSMSRGRDESTIEFMLKVLIQVLINFSLGLFMALLFFVLGLWNIIRSYQPNPIIAVAAFLLAAAAATSFVVSYLLAIYGAAAGGVYGLAKFAETSSRARLADQQRAQRIHYD